MHHYLGLPQQNDGTGALDHRDPRRVHLGLGPAARRKQQPHARAIRSFIPHPLLAVPLTLIRIEVPYTTANTSGDLLHPAPLGVYIVALDPAIAALVYPGYLGRVFLLQVAQQAFGLCTDSSFRGQRYCGRRSPVKLLFWQCVSALGPL